jgi:replicative DNA helicase
MSVGLALLSRVLHERSDLSALREAGINADSFQKEEKVVYTFIETHYFKHGVLPKQRTVEVETGVKIPKFPDEPLGFWIDGMKRRDKSDLVGTAIKELQSLAVAGELDEAGSVARNLVFAMERHDQSERITTLARSLPGVLEAHDLRQRKGIISGVPFGIEYLDRISDGAQPGDAVALVGRPGVGKSYLLLAMSNYAYEANDVPLVVTTEMTTAQCARRLVALRTGVSATLIRLGRMSFWGRRKVYDDITVVMEEAGRPFHLMQGTFNTTVEDIFIRVKELRPTSLYVDGAYLLRSKNKNQARWERVTETAEFLKLIASEFNIPTISTYQFNRKGPGLGNIGYSDAVGQLASIVIGIEEDEAVAQTSWGAKQTKLLTLFKGREGERGQIRILYDMEHMQIRQQEIVSGFDSEESYDG